MIEPMVKIEIAGMLDELDRTMELLQRLGTVQIEEIPVVTDADHKNIHRIHMDETREQLLKGYEELLSTVEEILGILGDITDDEEPLDDATAHELNELGPGDLLGQTSKITREVRRIGRQRRNLAQDLESALQYETLINTFLPLVEKAGALENMEQIGIILKKEESSVLPVLKNRINEITGAETLLYHQQMPGGKIGLFIVINPKDLSAVRQLIGNEGVPEYHIPREFRRGTLQESIKTIRSRIEDIPRELENIDRTIHETKKSHAASLRFIHNLSLNRLNQLRILTRLIRTNYTFMISGWSPASSFKTLKKRLLDLFDGSVSASTVRLKEPDYDHIPTLLTNKGMFRPFEVLLKLLPPPQYDNLDATPFITLFFPAFFGIILGDMGYGLALLIIAIIIKRKASKGSIISDVGTVAVMAGISTIFFGFLYGEFLGDLGEHFFGMKPVVSWLHRTEAIQVFLLLALGIGVIHVVLGFILKVYISVVMKHTKGVIEGLSKIIVILGIISVFVQLLPGFSPIIGYFGYAALAAGLLGVLFTEGIIGLLEIFSIFGNILSYSRIMAIGLASVILAMVANKLAEASHNIIAGILIGMTIHLINFVMGVFSPTIHSLRLHYVEFFTKFYMPSGKTFKPFKKIGGDFG